MTGPTPTAQPFQHVISFGKEFTDIAQASSAFHPIVKFH
jgi:hypothetical protein